MSKILQGITKYRLNYQKNMVEQFKKVRDNPVPTAVFFSCVDSRVITSRFTQTQVGDMFIVRNAGNLVPHSSLVSPTSVATEPAVLELACVMNSVEHVVVCGHSDCKAMNLLYSLHTDPEWSEETLHNSPLRSWISSHGARTIQQYAELEKSHFRRPLMLHAESPNNKFPAYVDLDEKYSVTDKLSMVNTLIQMQNVTSYPFMAGCLQDGRAHIHALWFDIYTGEVHCFSRKHKTFIVINDSTIEELMSEVEENQENVRTGLLRRSRRNDIFPGLYSHKDGEKITERLDKVERFFHTAQTSLPKECQEGTCDHSAHKK